MIALLAVAIVIAGMLLCAGLVAIAHAIDEKDSVSVSLNGGSDWTFFVRPVSVQLITAAPVVKLAEPKGTPSP